MTSNLKKTFLIPDMPHADDLVPYLRRIDEARWYSNFGPLVREFETRFAAAIAKAHNESRPACCVTTSSGYNALSIGMRLLGIDQAWRVLMPVVNFPACPLAVENMGATPVFADIDPDTCTLTPAIARSICARTKIDAVIPVSLYGFPLPSDEWDAFMAETGIPVLIDAAAAIETQTYTKRGLVAHSLHATKPFGVGEGGLVMTYDPELAERAHQMTNFGTLGRITRMSGENAKMSEYHAAVALAQLERWEGVKARRKTVYNLFKEELAPACAIAQLPSVLDKIIVSSLILRVPDVDAAVLAEKLMAQDIPVHRTYLPPLHLHPHFQNSELADAQGTLCTGHDADTRLRHLPGAAELNKCVIGLPFHSFMQPQDVHEIVKIFIQTLWKLTGCDNDNQFPTCSPHRS